MISLDDICDMCVLTREEIAAIAEHENTASFNAAVLGEYLMHQHHGPQHVQKMICEDIREALHADDVGQARELFAVLQKFISDHPEAVRGSEAT